MKEREKFGSRLGFILVSAGCAVGLGNVWKFPYICGIYGGAAFIVLYMICLLMLGLPILICEFTVGRGSGFGMGKAVEVLAPKAKGWNILKWLSMIGCYLLMMFYTMVGGWMLYYAYIEITGKMTGMNSEAVANVFSNMLAEPSTLILWAFAAIIISFGVCAMGLKNGIERITKIMMTLLIILMIILAGHSLTLDNVSEAMKFYLVPNYASIKEYGFGEIIFAAMTHAFFTLSVGIGCMEIFGSYLDKKKSLTGEAISVVLLDTFVALMAGFIIIPACFAYNVEPSSGPSLLFITLPNLFNNMSGGRIWGTMFFIFMSFAALSTIIAVFESILSIFMDIFGWERKKAVIVNIISVSVLSIPAILGFNLWSGFQVLGKGSTIMDFEDFLVSYNLLPLGSLCFVLFCVKKNGWGYDNFIKEVNTGDGMRFPYKIRFYMTYILPVIIAAIYFKGYYDMFVSAETPVFIAWMSFAVILLSVIFYAALFTGKRKTDK